MRALSHRPPSDRDEPYTGIQGMALVVGALGPDGLPAYYSQSLAGVNLWWERPQGQRRPTPDPVDQPVRPDQRRWRLRPRGGDSIRRSHAADVAALLMARGMIAQAARDRIIASAAIRNGLPELDAAAALGVPPTLRCAPSGGRSNAGTQGGGAPAPGSAGGTSRAPGASGTPAAGSPGAAAAAAAVPGTPGSTGPPGTWPAGIGAISGILATSAGTSIPTLIGVAALMLAGAAWLQRLSWAETSATQL